MLRRYSHAPLDGFEHVRSRVAAPQLLSFQTSAHELGVDRPLATRRWTLRRWLAPMDLKRYARTDEVDFVVEVLPRLVSRLRQLGRPAAAVR